MRSTLPSLPLSSPRMTRTVSPFDTCTFTRSALMPCLVCARFFRVFLYFRSRMLQDLRGQRDDLHVLLLAELARHRSEDTSRAGLARFIDDYDGVLVESDVRAVLPARFLRRADNDSARHL